MNISYSCGCVNTIDEISTALKSKSKCRQHLESQREVGALDARYYRELGAIDENNLPLSHIYIKEFKECLGSLPIYRGENPRALEIGCGCSMYAPMYMESGYSYIGVEPSKWAAEWMKLTHECSVIEGSFEDILFERSSFAAVLAAHSLEHMKDAPAVVKKVYDILAVRGRFDIIIPNDEDPLNPDHLWFFNMTTLRTLLYRSGFVVNTMVQRKRIERESFIYCTAVKV